MQIITESDFSGKDETHPWAKQFSILNYAQGGYSMIPHHFFRNWLNEDAQSGTFYIGRCSGLGVGSIVKYDAGLQNLRVGRFVAGGLNLKFLLNGQHEMNTISTAMLSIFGGGLQNAPPLQYPDSIIKNDVWLGDEVMMLGGGIIENGCVIGVRSLLPPNFRSEAYGIYAGSPAKLIRFRFSDNVREALVNLAWWNLPLSWIRDQNDFFLLDMTIDEKHALDIIEKMLEHRNHFMMTNA